MRLGAWRRGGNEQGKVKAWLCVKRMRTQGPQTYFQGACERSQAGRGGKATSYTHAHLLRQRNETSTHA